MRIRVEEDVEKKKQEIIAAAQTLVIQHGVEVFSMRKLAEEIHMTPGILYHYFQNKEALLGAVVKAGYDEIVQIIQTTKVPGDDIDEQIYQTFDNYIHGMLKRKELYQIMMNANYPVIAKQTQMLKEGISKERSSIQMLCMQIEAGKRQGIYVCEQVELRAQCIWCSVYGLLDHLIKEEVEEDLQERLIREQLNLLIGSLRYKE